MHLSAYAPLIITISGILLQLYGTRSLIHQMRAHGLRNLSCAKEANPSRQWGLTPPPAQSRLSISRCIQEKLCCSKCQAAKVAGQSEVLRRVLYEEREERP